MSKLDLSVIILTGNEELHIKRCIENVAQVAKEIFVIDCFSKDKTVEIARGLDGLNGCKVTVLQHEWPTTKYAGQFNWGLENAPITTKWVMRFDADEELSPELIKEMEEKIPSLPEDVTGVVINRFHIFFGKVMDKRIPTEMLRIFQNHKAICEVRLMDEHMQLLEGKTVYFENRFFDHNLNNISWICEKHIGYAIREAVDLLDIELDLTGSAAKDSGKHLGQQAESLRNKKHKYASMPLFWRSFFYFVYRYFVQREFLDGKEGFLWAFMQGWWYRTLVDTKVLEIKRACGTDKDKIIRYLKESYNISLN